MVTDAPILRARGFHLYGTEVEVPSPVEIPSRAEDAARSADAADNTLNVTPYANFLSIGYYVLLPEVSRGNPLKANSL